MFFERISNVGEKKKIMKRFTDYIILLKGNNLHAKVGTIKFMSRERPTFTASA